MPVRMVRRTLRLLREPFARAFDHLRADTRSGGAELRVTLPVTICRPEGTTVLVIGASSAGRNSLEMNVRAPDGSSCLRPSL